MILAPSQKWLMLIATLLGFLAVAAGAFGAHALKPKLQESQLSIFEVAVRYQMYHVFAIFVAVWIASHFPSLISQLSGWFFLIGTLIFSGSLFLLVFTSYRFFGALTPIGGLTLLLGWLSLFISVLRTII